MLNSALRAGSSIMTCLMANRTGNIKTLHSFNATVFQKFQPILFFHYLLKCLGPFMVGTSEVHLGGDIIVLLETLLCKRKNTAMEFQKLWYMVHHCMYVWCDIGHMVAVNERLTPQPGHRLERVCIFVCEVPLLFSQN